MNVETHGLDAIVGKNVRTLRAKRRIHGMILVHVPQTDRVDRYLVTCLCGAVLTSPVEALKVAELYRSHLGDAVDDYELSVSDLARLRAMCQAGHAKALRVASRLSLREVAAEIGVNQATVYRWEHGQRDPAGHHAAAYLRLLDALVGVG